MMAVRGGMVSEFLREDPERRREDPERRGSGSAGGGGPGDGTRLRGGLAVSEIVGSLGPRSRWSCGDWEFRAAR